MTTRLRIDGSRISDIPSLYRELNRVLMADEDWTLGESLDALDDVLYGGYGALAHAERTQIVWHDADAARRALGVDATIGWHRAKLAQPAVFAAARATDAIAALVRGDGATYFDLVLRVFADHPNVELVLA